MLKSENKCMKSAPTRKCVLKPRTDADLLSGLVRSSSIHPKLTQICSPNVQPLIPLILILSSFCCLFEGYPFCLIFYKVILPPECKKH